MTVCPPRGSNTALNHVLQKVKNTELSEEQKDLFKNNVYEIFICNPSKMFGADMAHILNIGSLEDVKKGNIDIPENNNSQMLKIHNKHLKR